MRLRSRPRLLLAGLSLTVIITGFLLFSRGSADDQNSPLDVFFQAVSVVRGQYVKKDLSNKDLYYGAIRGLLASLEDPYTRFIEPQDYREMQVHLRGSFSGVGIQIGIREGKLVVIAPIENTPAYRAGLKPLDVINAIGGRSTDGLALEKAVGLIRGPKGSKVTLEVWRPAENKSYKISMIRDTIKIASVRAKIIEPGVGYLRIVTFENEDTAAEVEKALIELKKNGAEKLAVDLRNNGGGILQNALNISDLFLSRGVIVQTIDREGDKRSFLADSEELMTGPVVVLVNEASASASEIMAGALQDNQRAKLVGERTFGKASVQNIKVLGDGSAILLTVAKYLTPSGRDISAQGITPDVLVAISANKTTDLASAAGAEKAALSETGERAKGLNSEEEDVDKVIEKIDPAADRQLAEALALLRSLP